MLGMVPFPIVDLIQTVLLVIIIFQLHAKS